MKVSAPIPKQSKKLVKDQINEKLRDNGQHMRYKNV